jgi:transposase-like protein
VVLAVRSGQSLRQVARQFHVGKSTVERWCIRAKGKRLDRVDWNDQSDGPVTPSNRSALEVEQCVLMLRKQLKETSPLGEHGADAILREMKQRNCLALPSRATVNRILKRHGELDGYRRKRFKAPPVGWYLKPLAKKLAELDQFDYIEDLSIEGGDALQVLNGISLHGGLVGSWPMSRMTSENTVQKLIEFWTDFGLPDYVQFDNSTVFQGSRWPDSLGKVVRCCLSFGVTPVFVPPRETGFQASVESYNGRWERGVWNRFRFENMNAVHQRSAAYVEATRLKNAERFETAPGRWQIPKDWKLDYSARPKGKVIFIRRTTEEEFVEVMGHWWMIPTAGAHKLVRAEVDLTKNKISFYRLRRREPNVHELLAVAKYHFPNKPFKE